MSAAAIVRSHPQGAAVTTWIVPGAKKTEIVGLHGDALRIRVAAPPEKGRANQAVARLLSDSFGAKVRLIAGATSRRKRLVVIGVEPHDLVAKIDDLVN